MQQFDDDYKAAEKARTQDPLYLVRQAFKEGELSTFAAQDLLRLFEVMQSTETPSKLLVTNKQRMKHFNENLDLSKGDKVLRKRDFENYERKKIDQFEW